MRQTTQNHQADDLQATQKKDNNSRIAIHITSSTTKVSRHPKYSYTSYSQLHTNKGL